LPPGYNSANEVVRDALRLAAGCERKPAVLNATIERGIADIEADRARPAEDVFAEFAREAVFRAPRNMGPAARIDNVPRVGDAGQ
jgi:Arc/MetJ-type ribon-helix-helix transcriptional regulator